MSSSIWKIIAAYVAWGLFPFYWKQISFVPAEQVIGHRIFWSFVTLALVMAMRREWPRVGSLKTFAIYAAAAVLISLNWFAYIWAVNHSFIVETSLGYFIDPLVNVLLAFDLWRTPASAAMDRGRAGRGGCAVSDRVLRIGTVGGAGARDDVRCV